MPAHAQIHTSQLFCREAALGTKAGLPMLSIANDHRPWFGHTVEIARGRIVAHCLPTSAELPWSYEALVLTALACSAASQTLATSEKAAIAAEGAVVLVI